MAMTKGCHVADVAIIGGGASGTLFAIHALRLAPAGATITLVEPSDRLGRGVAYVTEDPLHLLDAPAPRMSAFSDDEMHFSEWLARNAPGAGQSFVPRGLYGRYLEALLQDAAAGSAARFEVLRDVAVSIEAPCASLGSPAGEGLPQVRLRKVRLRDSAGWIEARSIVLATGLCASGRPRELADLGAEYLEQIWDDRGFIKLASRDARVLLLGTGLTMVDTALTLVARAHRGKIVALSPDGQLPQALQPESAARLHEIVAWHKLELKAGRILSSARLMKGQSVRAVRIEYFAEALGTPAKLETDLVLNCTDSGSPAKLALGQTASCLFRLGPAEHGRPLPIREIRGQAEALAHQVWERR